MKHLITSILNFIFIALLCFNAYKEASKDFLFGPFPFVILLEIAMLIGYYKTKNKYD